MAHVSVFRIKAIRVEKKKTPTSALDDDAKDETRDEGGGF